MGAPRHRERFFLPQPGARVGAAIALGRTSHRLAFAGTGVAFAAPISGPPRPHQRMDWPLSVRVDPARRLTAEPLTLQSP